VPFTPDLLEAHRQVMHFVCTNRAGNAAQSVGRVFERLRVAYVRGSAQGFEP